MTMSASLSATSGLNAIAHAVEALYAREQNPLVSLMAEEGIRSLARALPKIKADTGDVEARAEALYGAWLCGSCLDAVGMSLHHKLCHTLGGAFNLPHADTHAAILPHAVAYNASADPQAMARIARALGADEAAGGLFALAEETGARRSLQQLGMRGAGHRPRRRSRRQESVLESAAGRARRGSRPDRPGLGGSSAAWLSVAHSPLIKVSASQWETACET